MEVQLHFEPSCPAVGWLVGRLARSSSVIKNFFKKQGSYTFIQWSYTSMLLWEHLLSQGVGPVGCGVYETAVGSCARPSHGSSFSTQSKSHKIGQHLSYYLFPHFFQTMSVSSLALGRIWRSIQLLLESFSPSSSTRLSLCLLPTIRSLRRLYRPFYH